jgi:hypothetical protein
MADPGTYIGTVENLYATSFVPSYAWFYLIGTLDGAPFEGWLQIDPNNSDGVTNMMTIATAANHARTPVTAFVLGDPPGTVEILLGSTF